MKVSIPKKQLRNDISSLKFFKELCIQKYAEESKREESLISQASQMQAVFSISSVAYFMLLPVIIDHRGEVSLNLIFVYSSIIVFFLIISFVLASIVQWRYKIKAIPNVKDCKEIFKNNYNKFSTETDRLQEYILIIEDIQKNKFDVNQKRVYLVLGSMISFYISLFCCIVFYFLCLGKFL